MSAAQREILRLDRHPLRDMVGERITVSGEIVRSSRSRRCRMVTILDERGLVRAVIPVQVLLALPDSVSAWLGVGDFIAASGIVTMGAYLPHVEVATPAALGVLDGWTLDDLAALVLPDDQRN